MKYNAIILTDTVQRYIGSRVRPLGGYAIANTLRNAGYSVKVIDFFSDLLEKDILLPFYKG